MYQAHVPSTSVILSIIFLPPQEYFVCATVYLFSLVFINYSPGQKQTEENIEERNYRLAP